jgi:hypothetical protein
MRRLRRALGARDHYVAQRAAREERPVADRRQPPCRRDPAEEAQLDRRTVAKCDRQPRTPSPREVSNGRLSGKALRGLHDAHRTRARPDRPLIRMARPNTEPGDGKHHQCGHEREVDRDPQSSHTRDAHESPIGMAASGLDPRRPSLAVAILEATTRPPSHDRCPSARTAGHNWGAASELGW